MSAAQPAPGRLTVCVAGGGANMSVFGVPASWLTPDPGLLPYGLALLAIGFVMKAAQLPIRIDWQMHPATAPTPVPATSPPCS